MLLITYRCNLRCSYCYEPKLEGKVMSASDARRYIAETVDSLGPEYDDFEVQFMGGEPLLEFETIRNVSEWLWSDPLPLSLSNIFAVTNGTLLSEEMKDWFDRNRDRITVGLSFDGTDAMQNANRSESAGEVDLQYFATRWPGQAVKMTVSPYSLRGFAEGVIRLHSQGFGNVVVDLACGSKIGWNNNHLATLRDQLRILSDYYLENRHLTPCSSLRYDIFDLASDGEVSKRCGCGETLTCIDTDGRQYACHLFSPVACDARTVAEGLKLDYDNDSLFLNETCGQCSLVRLCPHCYGMNFATSGDPARQDPFICQSFKIIYMQNCAFRYRMALRDNDAEAARQIEQLIAGIN